MIRPPRRRPPARLQRSPGGRVRPWSGPGRRALAAAALLALVALPACMPGATRTRPRITSPVEAGDFVVRVPAEGRVTPLEQSIVACPQDFWGVKVKEVAEEGARVTTGEVVLELDLDQHRDRLLRRRRQLERVRVRVASLVARQTEALASSETKLREKRLALGTVEDKLGILLEGPLSERVESQRLQFEAGKALEEDRSVRLSQEEKLRARGFTSEMAYLDARGELEKARLNRLAAAQELGRLRGGPREEERGKLHAEAAMITLETRQSEQAHTDLGAVQELALQEARLERARREGNVSREEKRLARGVVESPASGVVLHSLYGTVGARVEPGSLLWSMQEVLRVVRLDRFEVEARVGERDVDRVTVGAAVEVRFPAHPGHGVQGEVTKVGKFAVPVIGGASDGPKEFEVEVLLPPGDHGLRPNLTARLGIEAARVEGGFRVVPEAAACDQEDACRLRLPDGREWRGRVAARDDAWVYFPGEPPGPEVLLGDEQGTPEHPEAMDTEAAGKGTPEPAGVATPASPGAGEGRAS